MPMPKIRITKLKDGREQAWFRDVQGRVRTRLDSNWTRADQVKRVADYGIVLQVDQARAGVGSDGARMPPLKGGHHAVFVARAGGRAVFQRKTYADRKRAMGLQPIRDLWGPGKDGHHMLEDIRINYLDDRRATIAITSKMGRIKARANEQRAAWWGWTAASVRKLNSFAAEVFQTGTAEALFSMGLIGAAALAEAKRMWRKVA